MTFFFALLIVYFTLSVPIADGLTHPLVHRFGLNITCDICRAFADLFDLGLSLNWTENKFLSEASALCSGRKERPLYGAPKGGGALFSKEKKISFFFSPQKCFQGWDSIRDFVMVLCRSDLDGWCMQC